MKTLRSTSLLLVVLGLAATCASPAADWPAYRGPRGDGISPEAIPATWPADGPKRLWRAETPAGFSSFAVAGDKAFTVVTRSKDGVPMETCVALDARSGRELWATFTGRAEYPGGGDTGAPDNRGGDGPRSTPTVDGNRVYVYSSALVLHCLDAATGKSLWQHDIMAEYAGRNISWKSGLSALVDGDLVFVAGGGPGQSMLAFDKTTGALVWKAGDEKMTHATPLATTLHGMRQVLFLMQSGLVAVNPRTGDVLWRFAFPFRVATACLPVVAGNVVFLTAGYEVGGAAAEIVKNGDAFEARPLWRVKGDAVAASLWSPPVHHDGHLYGMISFKQFGKGPLKCLDLKTGTLKWQEPGFGSGNVILANGRLVALTDAGQVVLVNPTPTGYRELARFKAVTGKCWSTPALANGRLYVRSTKEGACFDLTASRP